MDATAPHHEHDLSKKLVALLSGNPSEFSLAKATPLMEELVKVLQAQPPPPDDDEARRLRAFGDALNRVADRFTILKYHTSVVIAHNIIQFIAGFFREKANEMISAANNRMELPQHARHEACEIAGTLLRITVNHEPIVIRNAPVDRSFFPHEHQPLPAAGDKSYDPETRRLLSTVEALQLTAKEVEELSAHARTDKVRQHIQHLAGFLAKAADSLKTAVAGEELLTPVLQLTVGPNTDPKFC